MRPLLTLLALALASCSSSYASFEPAGGTTLPAPSVRFARVCDPSDRPWIERAGGVLIGVLRVEDVTGAGVEETAGVEAARVGGTHAVPVVDGPITQYGSRGTAYVRSGAIFDVYYVSRDRARLLPPELRR